MAKKKQTTTLKKTEELKPKQEVKANEHLFVMTNDEVFSLVQILSFSRDVFKQMSMNCAIEGDIKAETVYAARSELSNILYEKIRTLASIGEPTSRALH